MFRMFHKAQRGRQIATIARGVEGTAARHAKQASAAVPVVAPALAPLVVENPTVMALLKHRTAIKDALPDNSVAKMLQAASLKEPLPPEFSSIVEALPYIVDMMPVEMMKGPADVNQATLAAQRIVLAESAQLINSSISHIMEAISFLNNQLQVVLATMSFDRDLVGVISAQCAQLVYAGNECRAIMNILEAYLEEPDQKQEQQSTAALLASSVKANGIANTRSEPVPPAAEPSIAMSPTEAMSAIK